MKKPEYWVALSVIASALLILFVFTFALGKLPFLGHHHKLHVQFESVTGITTNSTVRFSGANVGRVTRIRVLPRSEQTPGTEGPYCIEVEANIDPKLELGDDISVMIRQDGLLGSRYIAIIPGSITSAPLDTNRVLMGTTQVELADLAGPGRDLITELKPVAMNLQPATARLGAIMARLDSITARLDDNLPDLIKTLDSVLNNGDQILSSVNSEENRERLTKLLANLRVVSDNLKVVTTNAKALTATLADKPWRLFFGGKTIHPPSESEVLKSDQPVPIQDSIEVQPVPPENIHLPAQKVP